MKLIDYTRVFAFLAFAGSAFLSTVFHYPVFTIFWFITMMLFMAKLSEERSELTILAFIVLAYIPLGLIATLSNYVSKIDEPNHISYFAWLLIAFVCAELLLALTWITSTNNE